jgi:hypothetical protein
MADSARHALEKRSILSREWGQLSLVCVSLPRFYGHIFSRRDRRWRGDCSRSPPRTRSARPRSVRGIAFGACRRCASSERCAPRLRRAMRAHAERSRVLASEPCRRAIAGTWNRGALHAHACANGHVGSGDLFDLRLLAHPTSFDNMLTNGLARPLRRSIGARRRSRV